jgi:tetratricopeptide (TPR) repeat protein
MTYGTAISIQQAIQIAVEHHSAGRLADAESVYRQILAHDPTQFDALHLSGVVAYQLGRHVDAIALIGRAIQQNPRVAAAHHHLGEVHRARNEVAAAEQCFLTAVSLDPTNAEAHTGLAIVYQSQGRADEALASFERAVAARPTWGGAHFNLGLTLKAQGKTIASIRSFSDGWKSDGTSSEAAGQCVQTLAEAVRAGVQELGRAPTHSAGPSLSFSIAFCSIDDAKCKQTVALYDRLFAGVDHEIIAIRDARSLAEAYNRAIASSRGDIVILSHDDINILADDFAARLATCFERADAVGVIGSETVAGPRWSSSDHPHLAGWITHRTQQDQGFAVDLVSPGPRRIDMKALDGVFLAARRTVFTQVPFDDSTFNGFHLYDIDWSCRAAAAGFTLGTAGDLLIVHHSRGRFDSAWQIYADRFCAKHGIEYRPPREAIKIYEAVLESEEQVTRFFGHLESLNPVQ